MIGLLQEGICSLGHVVSFFFQLALRRTAGKMKTREEWLNAAIEKIVQPIFKTAGLNLPAVKISVGFPSRRALVERSKRRVGECWHKDGISQDNAHIFISPVIGDPLEVLGTVIHELIHAALPQKCGHNRTFALKARACGLTGKPTATTNGKELTARLNAELKTLPPYPHVAFDAVLHGRKKQSTRLRLYECDCPVKVRVASDDFDATCNVCCKKFIAVKERPA